MLPLFPFGVMSYKLTSFFSKSNKSLKNFDNPGKIAYFVMTQYKKIYEAQS